MKKNKALSKIIKSSLICRECGRSSPNPYGECLCSYDMNMFTDINWSLVADKLYEKE